MTRLGGACHCGNVSVRFESAKAASDLALRACQCGFCRKHGVRTTTDPGGRIAIAILDPALVRSYEFGLHAAGFLICTRCGVYVAAVLEHEGRSVATLNVNVLDGDPFAGRSPVPADYAAESAGERRARRLRVWTPVEVSATG